MLLSHLHFHRRSKRILTEQELRRLILVCMCGQPNFQADQCWELEDGEENMHWLPTLWQQSQYYYTACHMHKLLSRGRGASFFSTVQSRKKLFISHTGRQRSHICYTNILILLAVWTSTASVLSCWAVSTRRPTWASLRTEGNQDKRSKHGKFASHLLKYGSNRPAKADSSA